MRTLRIIGSIVTLIASVLFLLLAITLPLMLRSQAAQDRHYYAAFQQAALAHAHDPALRNSRLSYEVGSIDGMSTATGEVGCDGGFRKLPTDLFVLQFWRGEWTECYAYPSGRTTLAMSLAAYLRSGAGIQLAIYWLLGLGFGWIAWRLMPRPLPVSRNVG